MRGVSPASSVGTTYPPDQTSLSDSEEQLSQEDFEKKWEARLKLGQPSDEEELYLRNPIFPLLERGPETKEAKQSRLLPKYHGISYVDWRTDALHTNLRNLRAFIREKEENELFEQTMLRGSQVALPEEPPQDNIDKIMASMLVNVENLPSDKLAKGPWEKRTNVYEGGAGTGLGEMSVNTSGTMTGTKAGQWKGRVNKT